MKNLGRMLVAENDEEAIEKGHRTKIWDGSRWFEGILYKKPYQIGKEEFSVVEVM